jgi:hypothetical protein
MSLTMLCCFKNCFNGLGFSAQHIPRPEINNPIVLDTAHMGEFLFYENLQ